MKGSVRKKEYKLLLIALYIFLPLIGWLFYGIITAGVGLILAYLVDLFFPKWKYDLTWKEIDTALNNLYEYGQNPSYFWFYVENRKLYVYRDERGDGNNPIRMAVSIPIKDWSDLLGPKDYDDLYSSFGGEKYYSINRGQEQCDIYTKVERKGPEDCKQMLKFLFEKAAGGLRPEIMAQSNPCTKKTIWLDHNKDYRSV